MASYKWLYVMENILRLALRNISSFHASRYPAKPSDVARKFHYPTHNHVVFIRKNKFYQVPLLNSAGVELSAAELEVWGPRTIQHHKLSLSICTAKSKEY